MKYNIEYDIEKKCVMANLEGEIELKYLRQLFTDVADVLKKHNCKRVLYDMHIALANLFIIEIDEVPKIASQIGFDASIKRALVISDDFKKYNFFESTSRAHRQDVKIFSSYSGAERWVLSDEQFSSQAIPISQTKKSK